MYWLKCRINSLKPQPSIKIKTISFSFVDNYTPLFYRYASKVRIVQLTQRTNTYYADKNKLKIDCFPFIA